MENCVDVVLVSDIRHESVIVLYIYILSLLTLPPLSPYHPSKSARLGSLCYIETSDYPFYT